MTTKKISRRSTKVLASLLSSAIRIARFERSIATGEMVETSATAADVMTAITGGWAREIALIEDESGRRLVVQRYSTDAYRAVLA